MNVPPDNRLPNPPRSWSRVEARVARDRAERARTSGSAATPQAMWATECELRAAPGYARARRLDLQHHVRWRLLLDEFAAARNR